MDLIENGNLVSPEVKVPQMLQGLKTLYGKKCLSKILKSFDVRKIEDFFMAEKFYQLSDFYHDAQNRIISDPEYRESIGIEVHRVKLSWVKK
jgi:hypothetical protein